MGDVSDLSEIMTLSQTAEYLQLAEKTVLRMAQRGEIPAAKVASQWRFLRPVLRDWLAGQMQTLPPARLKAVSRGDTGLLPISEITRPNLIATNIAPGPKESVLRQLIAPLIKSKFITDGARLLRGLIERETMMTTAIGHRVAVPHPRRPLPGLFPEPALVVGLCRDGTDFDAVDDQRVHVLFLICATREEVHLRLMATIGWLVRAETLVDQLIAARTARTIHRRLLTIAQTF